MSFPLIRPAHAFEPPHPMNTLQLNQVSKAFSGTVALDGLSIEIAPGEIYGLLGPNGAGVTLPWIRIPIVTAASAPISAEPTEPLARPANAA